MAHPTTRNEEDMYAANEMGYLATLEVRELYRLYRDYSTHVQTDAQKLMSCR